MSSIFETDFRPDLRRARADSLAHEVMRKIEPYIKDGRLSEDDQDCRKYTLRALIDLFYGGGWEAITDQMRAEAGLPIRDDKGWTALESHILEQRRIETLLRPMPSLIMKQQDDK